MSLLWTINMWAMCGCVWVSVTVSVCVSVCVQWRIQGGGGPNRPWPSLFAAEKKGKRKERKKRGVFLFFLLTFSLGLHFYFFLFVSSRFMLIKSIINGSNVARRRKCAVKLTANAIAMHWFHIRVHCMHGSQMQTVACATALLRCYSR